MRKPHALEKLLDRVNKLFDGLRRGNPRRVFAGRFSGGSSKIIQTAGTQPKRRQRVKRRTQVVVARRKRIMQTTVAGVKLGVAMVLLIGLAAAARNYLYTSSHFAVHHIGVTGNAHVRAQTIIRASGISEGCNIFKVDLIESAAAIENIPRIRSARIRRMPPDEIYIEVTERQPLALVLSRKLLYVDEDARVLDEYDPTHTLDAPIISGTPLSGVKVGDTVKEERFSRALEIVKAINQLDLASHLQISEINIDNPAGIVLVAERSGATIILGLDDLEAKMWRLAKVAEAIEQSEHLNVANLERLDMRFEAIVPAKFKEAHS
ncbi:MAG: hypothetical protein Kow0099_11040 [Candidatus Abyssubacteria bacterium]